VQPDWENEFREVRRRKDKRSFMVVDVKYLSAIEPLGCSNADSLKLVKKIRQIYIHKIELYIHKVDCDSIE
jgi:hypothetical protein